MKAAKIHVCHCEQCRYIKNMRKNRKSKAVIRRLMNKRRRKNTDEHIHYYWL